MEKIQRIGIIKTQLLRYKDAMGNNRIFWIEDKENDFSLQVDKFSPLAKDIESVFNFGKEVEYTINIIRPKNSNRPFKVAFVTKILEE